MKIIRKQYKDGFFVDLIDYYDCLASWYEHSEIETQNWVLDCVGDDWVSLDCGAHIGYYAMLFAHCAPRGKVYAFEANPAACRKFWTNVAYNVNTHHREFCEIELCHTALGAEVAEGVEADLWFSGAGADDGRTHGKFNFTTVDSFVAYKKLERLDLIKTDVDGYDYELLLGARETIRQFKPVIIAEVNYALGYRGYSEKDVERFIEEVGYRYAVLDFPSPTNWIMWAKT